MRFLWLLLFITSGAWSHQSSLTSSGHELFWANKNIALQINPNNNDLDPTVAKNIIRDSMAQWNLSSTAKLNEVAGAPTEIRFASNFNYGSAVIGVTELNHTASGGIQKATIILNDDYTFRDTPGLYPTGQVFLGDVVTHELGHLLGLSHSEVLNSTMFYSAFSGQSTVAFDDKSGVKQKYDTGHGLIYGKVQGGNHIGVLGVHVQAISRKTGESSSVISDENGNFYLGGLDLDDTYYLYTSPLKNTSSLPGYFSNSQTNFCPAAYKGSFFSACGRENDGKPQGINLSASQSTVNVGVVSINCALRSDEDYSYQKIQSQFSPVEIMNYAIKPKNEQAFVGWFRKTNDTNWMSPDIFTVDLTSYFVSGASKYMKVSLVSFPFGTKLEYTMSIKKDNVLIAGASRNISYSALTKTYNPDFESFVLLDQNPARNNYEISISAKELETFYTARMFPSAADFTSSTYLPYLIIVSLWENNGSGMKPLMDNGSNVSDNYSCLEAPFTYAVSRTNESNSTSSATSSGAEAGAAAAGCGTIEPPSSGGPGSSLPLIALGFLLAMLPTILSKSSKKFLS